MGRVFGRGCALSYCARALCAGAVEAGVVSLSSASLDDLCGGNAQLVGDNPEVALMSNSGIRAEIISAAFNGDAVGYAYLYQIKSASMANSPAVETHTRWPFREFDDNTLLGWLRGDIHAGFLNGGGQSGGAAVDKTAFVNPLPEEPIISYYVMKRYGEEIGYGEHSEILYAAGSPPSDEITNNVIGGDVGSGEVVGPLIPEPIAIIYLAMAGLASFVAMAARR